MNRTEDLHAKAREETMDNRTRDACARRKALILNLGRVNEQEGCSRLKEGSRYHDAAVA
jgi:hypothetical protein